MSNEIDFDEDELHDVVLELVTEFNERYKSYEKTHGPNFAGSLCATMAKEMLVMLAWTSPSVDSIAECWTKIIESAHQSLSDVAMHQMLMKKFSLNKENWNGYKDGDSK